MDFKRAIYSYTLKYYSAVNRKEVLVYTTRGMNLANILSKRNQSPKSIYCMSSPIRSVQNRKIYKDRGQITGCLGLGKKWNEK